MSRQSRLRQLLQNPRIWTTTRGAVHERPVLPTGFAALDEWLGGGWPLGVLTELLLEREGAGELSLLMPALAHLIPADDSVAGMPAGIQGSRVAWVAPPHIPYAPALLQHGIDISRMLVVTPERSLDVLWATEQALRSTVCGAVLAWLASPGDRALRRLQLAAEHGHVWAVIFRAARFAAAPSPAPLRIYLQPGAAGPQLQLLRNRYGRIGTLAVAL